MSNKDNISSAAQLVQTIDALTIQIDKLEQQVAQLQREASRATNRRAHQQKLNSAKGRLTGARRSLNIARNQLKASSIAPSPKFITTLSDKRQKRIKNWERSGAKKYQEQEEKKKRKLFKASVHSDTKRTRVDYLEQTKVQFINRFIERLLQDYDFDQHIDWLETIRRYLMTLSVVEIDDIMTVDLKLDSLYYGSIFYDYNSYLSAEGIYGYFKQRMVADEEWKEWQQTA